jgi:hypothetical protein
VESSLQVQRTGSKLLQSWENSPDDPSMFGTAQLVSISIFSAPHLILSVPYSTSFELKKR